MPPCSPKRIFFFALCLFLISCCFFGQSRPVKAIEFLPTEVEVLVACGNGIIESANLEVCDPGDPPDVPPDIGSSTCQDFPDIFGDPFAAGELGCLGDCSDFDTEYCYTCGNTYKETSEECDTDDFGGSTCMSLGFDGGTLLCTPICTISTINCEERTHEGGLPGGGGGGSSRGGGTGVSSGFKPGSETEEETKVIIRGKSYPNSDVHILVDGAVIGIVKSDAKADFYFETDEVSSGVTSFSFWAEDSLGLKSTTLSLTFRVISGAVTTISGVYIAPSIDIDKQSVRQGEEIRIYGQTVPDIGVEVHIHSESQFIEETNSVATGDWELYFNTEPLEEDFHIAKALFEVEADGNVIKSGFSRSISFYVGGVEGTALCPEADLNHDERVNLTDFSILLYYWGTDNECADQNQNGNVELIDFSIMMYYWTG